MKEPMKLLPHHNDLMYALHMATFFPMVCKNASFKIPRPKSRIREGKSSSQFCDDWIWLNVYPVYLCCYYNLESFS